MSNTVLEALGAMTLGAETASGGQAPWWVSLIPLLPILSVIWCGLTASFGIKSKSPAWATVGALAASFALTVAYFALGFDGTGRSVSLFEWIGLDWTASSGGSVNGLGQRLSIPFGFYFDGLSMLWMLFVTGLATLIAVYASEYMEHDVGPGYARFFAAFGLFVFSMSCLVMGSNMLMMFLGWEGVGLCSYLLIGYFYKKPEAVAAGKKAFVVNRIGDLGLLMAVFLTFTTFGTLEYVGDTANTATYGIFDWIAADRVPGTGEALSESWQVWAIPLLLITGAFGKSAQVFFYVWLPDAMEGPTPVSALIHAATMVTAGVYLVARFTPLFLADPDGIALSVVTWSGAITAFWAGTIAMAQFDIKRIMGYSTVSQLGYMFAGLGVLTTTGGVFHVLTHAFFKATLFLACGAVMHGFAGQLDMRKLSGLWGVKGFRMVCIAMFIGCLNLSGVVFTAGYFSKDMILAEAFYTPDSVIWGSSWAGWLLLITAGLTAYYTFRVFFRVFVGPVAYEAGDDHHGDDHGHDHAHDFHPHGPRLAMNGVLAVLTIASIAATSLYFVNKKDHGWTGSMVHVSSADLGDLPWSKKKDAAATAAAGDTPAAEYADAADKPMPALLAANADAEAGKLFGQDPHKIMYYVSAVIGTLGILIAAFLHGPKGIGGLFIGNRTRPDVVRADGVASLFGVLRRGAERKWLVDEFYGFLIVRPLDALSYLFFLFDRFVIDGIVDAFGALPRWIAQSIRPVSQTGVLHDYALRMVGGVAVVLVIAAVVLLR